MNRTNLTIMVSFILFVASCKKYSDNPENITSDSGNITYCTGGDTIFITYNGSSASVVKPQSDSTVYVEVSGSKVTVNSTIEKEMYYKLTGTASNGRFKIYSNNAFNVIMNGTNITNSDGPAVNIQSGKICTVTMVQGTTNSLTDGSSYVSSTEDQKATLFSEAALIFKGTGALQVKGNVKHAICSDKYVEIQNGNITVSGSTKDGIHTNDYFAMSGGALNITSSDDGIECEEGYILISGGTITTLNIVADTKGITCDSTMTISGGTISITLNGNQTKGLKSNKNMTLSGGNMVINTTGAVVLTSSGSGSDPSYCTGIKCDSSIIINGADITITSTGAGGKGVSADNNITMTSGSLKITTSGGGATYTNSSGKADAYSATCITADGNIYLLGGNVTTSSSGLGGKGISATKTITLGETGYSLNINVITTGTKFLVSGTDYCHPKAIKCDGSIMINNGTITVSSSDDGIHAETAITQNNGNVTINNSYEGVESKFITINGGSLSVVASNDGFNATAGLVSGGSESDDGSKLIINGGTVSSNVSSGDGFDSNGSISVTGGTVIIQGPPSSPEVGVDCNGSFLVSGGLLVASGPSSGNMIQVPTTSSTQYSIEIVSSSSSSSGTGGPGSSGSATNFVTAGTLVHIQDANGKNLVTFQPARNIYYLIFSSPDLNTSSTYSLYTGGTATGTNISGLYTDVAYSGGTLLKSFNISGSVTKVTY